MDEQNSAAGSVWLLRRGGLEIARLAVTGGDMPWTYAEVEAMPGFEDCRTLFAEQERALEGEDWELAEDCHARISAALTLVPPAGGHVSEYLLRVYDDGTAGWRWDG